MIDVHFNLSLMIIYVGLLGQDVDLDHVMNDGVNYKQLLPMS